VGGGLSGDKGDERRYEGRGTFRAGRTGGGKLAIVSLGMVLFFAGLCAAGRIGVVAWVGEAVSRVPCRTVAAARPGEELSFSRFCPWRFHDPSE